MKMKSLLIFIVTYFITLSTYAIDTKAENAIVIDYNTNEILFEKNAYIAVPPASMTKIMTVYVIFDRLENSNLTIENTCSISAKAYNMRGSRTFLEIGERVKIKDLLRGIIIQSGNDASVAIAECLSGTENDFAILMNAYAKTLGMKNSNFINSSGWPNDNHFSTAYDIAMLSNSIIRDFPDLYNFFNEKEFKYNNIEQPNRNKLLDYVDGADGLKTGYTKLSGWGMAGSAKRNNRRVTVVINGTNSSRSRLTESSNLLNWAFSQTFQKKLISKNQIIKNVDVWLGKKHSVNLVAENDVVSTLSYDQLKLIESEITYSSPLPAKINIGEKLGLMTIKISGKPEIKINLVSEETIGKTNPLIRIFSVIKYLIFGSSLDE